jgi:hypothetical protein
LRRYFCGKRGLFGLFGKMDRKKYHYNRYLGIVIPNDPQKTSTYVLIIDENRRFRTVKNILLKKVEEIAEMLAN